jgi:glycosyltransferase involved in cell wall biosynthesis
LSSSIAREFLIDVSRLIWRSWRGRHATGIDRVCLAYLVRYGPRSLAVIQRRGRIFVLTAAWSDRLRRQLLQPSGRGKLLQVLVPALATARHVPPFEEMTYLNVGHTGLDEPSLADWIASNKVRAVYLVHDLIPLTHPEFCRPFEGAKHEQRMKNVLASASGVIANSADTLHELARFAASKGSSMPAGLVAWLGIEPLSAQDARPAEGRPYFITVGTIEARKNHLLLLNVWERLARSLGENTPSLLIVGGRGWEAEEAFRRLDELGDLDGHVREVSACGDRELEGWLRGARALLMPSFVEGFGLPVMEALSLGTPVIASDLSVYREIVGDVPTYLHPTDTLAWETAVRSFSEDSPERDRQLDRLATYRPPRWDDHFRIVDRWLAGLQTLSPRP